MLRTVLILVEVVLLAGPPRACLCGAACAAPRPEASGEAGHERGCPACGGRHTAPGHPKPAPRHHDHVPGCPCCLRQPSARIERAELAQSFWLTAAPLPVPADVTAAPVESAAPAVAAPPVPATPLFLAICSLRI
jgi:hypothetical protein